MISFSPEQRFIVTGASSGIGEDVALLLNELGATIVGIGRDVGRLESMKAKSKYPENVFLEQKDLIEDVAGLPVYVKSLKEKYGRFRGMVYCAGIAALAPLQQYDYDYAQKVFAIHYFAPLMMTKAMADMRNNVGHGTSLVYLSSLDAVLASRGQSLYSGAKSALATTMRAISKEVTHRGVRVNCLLPSMIKTPMTQGDEMVNAGISEAKSDQYPFGWGEPRDVANLVVFLLSDKAKYISGQNYIVDSGGML